jgi:hypothetical protein
MQATSASRRLSRSVVAVIAGALVGIALSVGTDALLRVAGVLPAPGQAVTGTALLVATIYRTIYGVLGSYITARVAPYGPMAHSMVLGFMGLAANLAGTIATWNKNLGPHWYPVALIVLALPTAWMGGRIRIAQLRKTAAVV